MNDEPSVVHDASKPAERARRFAPKLRVTECGTEKLCTRCNEWWPADGEFFAPDSQGSGQLYHYCRACHIEWRRSRRDQRSAGAALTKEVAQ